MENKIGVIKRKVKQPVVLRMMHILLKVVLTIFFMVAVAYSGFAWYVHTHKTEVLDQVTLLLNEKINGSLSIGNMEPTLLENFPGMSIRLQNVVIRDSLYNDHKQTLLTAGDAFLSVNTLALLRGAILIKKVSLKNAALNLYTNESGYSNTAAFKKRTGKEESGSGSFPELKKLELKDVSVTIDNRLKNKLYKFTVFDAEGNIDDSSTGWEAEAEINTLVHSLAFNTVKGSFIKGHVVEGDLDIAYNENTGILNFRRNKLNIGDEDFYISAAFNTIRPKGDFSINIDNNSIAWRSASRLLTPNISGKLDKFNFKKPISVSCKLSGFLNVRDEPLIVVNAGVEDNILSTPGGDVTNCSFTGKFTNEHTKGKGLDDNNSVIEMVNFKGSYADIPFTMRRAQVLDLKNPIVTGDFSSEFDIHKLTNLIDEDLMKFSRGKATIDLAFRANVDNFKLSRPFVQGKIKVKNASLNYVPRNLQFSDINVALDFANNDLNISKINLKRGKSILEMEGNIKNFLNLYYTDPERVVLSWNIYSPHLHLNDFIAFAGNRKRTVRAVPKEPRKGNFTEEFNTLFEKSQVDLKLRVDKLYQKSFYAGNARADILLTEKALVIKNASLQHADGYIRVDGQILQTGSSNSFAVNAGIVNVDISKFMKSFDNFGMATLTAGNLAGSLSSKAAITGKLNAEGEMMSKSMEGKLQFNLKNGRLINFEPIRKIGEFAFPNRDINNISFSALAGTFDVKGDKVTIHPMQINSSVLNMDISGVYSFGPGTEIFVDVPIRNPKRDEGITDKKKLEKRRNRGIVLHLVAEDDKDGKVKVKLGRKRKS
jgi:hypothetical protein